MQIATIDILTRGEDLPIMSEKFFFHSPELFRILEKTPGCTPYMAVCCTADGKVVSHLLATVNRRGSFLPPYLYSVGRIYGEGEYTTENAHDKSYLFDLMLDALTTKLKHKFCLFIEVSDLSKKMFGYKTFRSHNYYPVRWMQIHNSLHSKSPKERLSEKMQQRISNVYEMGVTTAEVSDSSETEDFYNLLRSYYRFKFQRFIPHKVLFEALAESHHGSIFVTRYKNKVIGGCAVAYTGGDAYLWYIASRRATYLKQHPNLMTVWHALEHAYEHGYAHLHFMNVGLPFRKNPMREFILKFGGKPASTYRWFRCSIGFINKILKWIYKE